MARIRPTHGPFSFMRPLLPFPARTGRPRADDRRTLAGSASVLIAGGRWQELPAARAAARRCDDGGDDEAGFELASLLMLWKFLVEDTGTCAANSTDYAWASPARPRTLNTQDRSRRRRMRRRNMERRSGKATVPQCWPHRSSSAYSPSAQRVTTSGCPGWERWP